MFVSYWGVWVMILKYLWTDLGDPNGLCVSNTLEIDKLLDFAFFGLE